ncbi:MAG: hypothetical protein ABH877_00245, partial [bacterium]
MADNEKPEAPPKPASTPGAPEKGTIDDAKEAAAGLMDNVAGTNAAVVSSGEATRADSVNPGAPVTEAFPASGVGPTTSNTKLAEDAPAGDELEDADRSRVEDAPLEPRSLRMNVVASAKALASGCRADIAEVLLRETTGAKPVLATLSPFGALLGGAPRDASPGDVLALEVVF